MYIISPSLTLPFPHTPLSPSVVNLVFITTNRPRSFAFRDNIFTSVVNRYTVAKLVKEKESGNKKEIKKVNTAKALRAVKTVKMWKLQKGNS
jgi:hypothetical protein